MVLTYHSVTWNSAESVHGCNSYFFWDISTSETTSQMRHSHMRMTNVAKCSKSKDNLSGLNILGIAIVGEIYQFYDESSDFGIFSAVRSYIAIAACQ